MKFVNAALSLLAVASTSSAFTPAAKFGVRNMAAPSVFELEAKKSIEDLSDDELKGKKVLVRCDVNVPLDGKTITDDTRIRSSIPTIEFLKSKGAIVTVCSHLGRPKDGPEDKFSLGPCAERMSELLDQTVTLAPDCIGDDVAKIVADASEGDVIMLENTRFYKEETANEPEFVEKLAAPFDLFVNDAFGTAHRAHASTEGVTKFLSPSVSGFLLAKELEYLDGAVTGGEKPMAAIVGGSKVSSKITVLEALLDKCDKIIIGGGMVFTFLKAKGLGVGTSLVEDDFVDTAKEVLEKAEKLGKQILLPSDIVVADSFAPDAKTQIVPVDAIPDGWMGLDNGPETTKEQKEALSDCKTVIMNGPMGVFEFEAFAKGTFGIVDILADITKDGAVTIIGGGDSVAACEQSGRASEMSHISTGGGASLELLEGKVLPGVAALADKPETIAKKSIEDLSDAELKGKKVLVRCDVNVPLDGKTITDDTRIRSSIPTIEYLKSKGAIVTVCSHLGRPKDGPEDKFSLGPCAERMSELLDQKVTLAPDCIGDDVAKIVADASEGDVIMLENTRFYKEETKNEPEFVEKLAAPFDLFVNDAFGTAHRAHASTEGVTKFLTPSVSGFLLAKELEYLDGAVTGGEKPMAAIVGGSKVSSKITVLEALLDKCDKIIIGGGMVFTFLKAKGLGVGTSLVEDDFVDTAKEVLEKAEKLGKQILLPSDIVVADSFAPDAKTQIVPVDAIPDGWMGLDNGPETTKEQKEALSDCKTVIMNGPMGVFEFEAFAKGTFGIVDILADITKDGAVTIIGGGDSVAACEQSGRASEMSHISTGGGASLELLEGKVLPGVAALADK